jgi:uncharacterized membrane protein SpoIIM required for sporulation
LEAILNQLDEYPDRTLTLEEARRFHFLYQKVSADLGRIATFASEPQTRAYLESLVARAYGEIHGTREKGHRKSLSRWFVVGFPRAFRRHWSSFALAVMVMLVGAGFGGTAIVFDQEAKQVMIPSQFSPLLGDPAERVAREEGSGGKHMSGREASFASTLMVNNIRVSIMSMALGMFWGAGTLVVMFYNGVLLGVIAVDYIRAGQTVFLLGWLLPHGAIEIPAVLFAGQAGFVLGRALIGRHEHTPLNARLRKVGPDVSILIGGVAVLLVWAGLVEAFFSQYHEPVLPYWLKIAFGVTEMAALIWFLNTGRQARPRTDHNGL